MLQRNVSGSTLAVMTDPPCEIEPGGEIEHDTPITGFTVVDAVAEEPPVSHEAADVPPAETAVVEPEVVEPAAVPAPAVPAEPAPVASVEPAVPAAPAPVVPAVWPPVQPAPGSVVSL